MIYKAERIPESRIDISLKLIVKGIEASGKYKHISTSVERSPGLLGYVGLIIVYEEIADHAKIFKWRHPLGAFASGLKKKDGYQFRGEINIQKVILDCLKDNKVGFIVIEKEHFWFGVNREILKYLPLPVAFMTEWDSALVVWAFLTNKLPKKRVPIAVEFLKEAQKIWAELPEKLNKEIRKTNRKMDKAGIKRETVKVKVF